MYNQDLASNNPHWLRCHKIQSTNQLSVQTDDWYEIELLVLYSNTWNHLTVSEQMSSVLFKMLPTNYSSVQSAGTVEYTDCIYIEE